MMQKKINLQQQHESISSSKEACYTSYKSSNSKNSYAHIFTKTWFYHKTLSPHDEKISGPSWHPLLVAKQ